MGKRNNHRYTEEFRMEVMSYLYSHNGDRVKTRTKFGLNESSLRNWIRKYSGEEKCVSLQSEIEKNEPMGQQKASESDALLKKKIEELEKALEFEKMRSRAFEKMIEIAEKEENIIILKKGGAKQ